MSRQTPPRRQLALTLPHAPAFSRDDFIEGASNRSALAAIERWPAWAGRMVYLEGPAGSGKTHLVAIWAAASGAAVAPASLLAGADPEAILAGKHVAIEDLEPGTFDEAALFHLVNLARERGGSILLTSRFRVAALGLRVADLGSRLRSAELYSLAAPDDALLRQVIVKLFADRQVAVEKPVVDYALGRIERSLDAVNRFVEAVDRLALESGRPVTRRLAAEALPGAPGGAGATGLDE